MDSILLSQQMLLRGLELTLPGDYALKENVYFSPSFPANTTNWHSFAVYEGLERPCGIRVMANDVTLNLKDFTLSGSSEVTQGLVLIYVQPGVRNFTLLGGTLQLCSIGVFTDSLCSATLIQDIVISNFTQKGVLAYSPQGLTIERCIVGPNLSDLAYVSQETLDLARYSEFVKARDLRAWATSFDDLKVHETSHVVGIDIVPDALHDSPYPPEVNSGADIQLTDVRVQKLTMYMREHSILVSKNVISGEALLAFGSFGEPLPEWYTLRRGAAARKIPNRRSFYPSLVPTPNPWTLTSDFPSNTADDLVQSWKTIWVRGVDRQGSALRGVQGVLIAGVSHDTIALSNLSVEEPVIKVLSSRVRSPAPRDIEARDLTVNLKASRVAIAPAKGSLKAPNETRTCCSTSTTQEKIIAGLYLTRGSNSSSRAGYPPSNVPPIYQGSVAGVYAPSPLPM